MPDNIVVRVLWQGFGLSPYRVVQLHDGGLRVEEKILQRTTVAGDPEVWVAVSDAKTRVRVLEVAFKDAVVQRDRALVLLDGGGK